MVYPDIADHPKFSYDNSSFLATTCFCIAINEPWVVAFLNSKTTWWLIKQATPSVRGGFHRLKAQYLENIPVPVATSVILGHLDTLSLKTQLAAKARRDLQASFRRRILTDLAPGGTSARLTKKLADWAELDFKTFNEEVKKQFKQPIPLAERDDWQRLFESNKTKIAAISAEIVQHERAIAQI